MFQVRLCNRISSKYLLNLRQQHQRSITTTNCACKKYKYAIDPKNNVSHGSTLSNKRNLRRKGRITFVEGKALTYFQLDGNDYSDDRTNDVESPKQKAYAVIVQSAVESLLTSSDAPQELRDACIEIVTVDVHVSLMSAIVVWKPPDYVDKKYTKDETTANLEKFMPIMGKLLPAHSTVTQTPEVTFVYDTISAKQQEMDELFERLKIEEMEFEERMNEKNGPVNEVHSIYVTRPKKEKKKKKK